MLLVVHSLYRLLKALELIYQARNLPKLFKIAGA